jgi:hypothetical protein
MEIINLPKDVIEFINSQGSRFDIGGFSNLNKNDLNKATRHDYQLVGLGGEASWFLRRDGNIERWKKMLDMKYAHWEKTGKGDDGIDDIFYQDGIRKGIDVKTSHVEDIKKIQYLNLIIPKREFHDNRIYVAAFTIGPARNNFKHVALVGWIASHEIDDKLLWKGDPSGKKYGIPMSKLHKLPAANPNQ